MNTCIIYIHARHLRTHFLGNPMEKKGKGKVCIRAKWPISVTYNLYIYYKKFGTLQCRGLTPLNEAENSNLNRENIYHDASLIRNNASFVTNLQNKSFFCSWGRNTRQAHAPRMPMKLRHSRKKIHTQLP